MKKRAKSLDLHGLTIHQGWQLFKEAIIESYYKDERKIVVITGKGAMLRELPMWAEDNPNVRETSLRQDGGSFIVKLKRRNNGTNI